MIKTFHCDFRYFIFFKGRLNYLPYVFKIYKIDKRNINYYDKLRLDYYKIT